VKSLRVVRATNVVLAATAPESIGFGRRSPVESRNDRVAAISVVVRAVTSALCNIDLAALRPRPIDAVFRHHPDGRPEPVTLRHLGDDLDLSVLDVLLALSGHASTADWVDDCAGGLVAVDGAHGVVGRSACLSGSEIERVTIVELRGSDVGRLRGQGRHDVQAFSIGVCILWVVGGPVK